MVNLDDALNDRLLDYLEPRELRLLQRYLGYAEPIWSPLEGPQMEAYVSPANVTGYGGAAGGG